MAQLSDEEREEILNSKPIGTWFLLISVTASMVLGWLFLYYGVFIPRGVIN